VGRTPSLSSFYSDEAVEMTGQRSVFPEDGEGRKALNYSSSSLNIEVCAPPLDFKLCKERRDGLDEGEMSISLNSISISSDHEEDESNDDEMSIVSNSTSTCNDFFVTHSPRNVDSIIHVESRMCDDCPEIKAETFFFSLKRANPVYDSDSDWESDDEGHEFLRYTYS